MNPLTQTKRIAPSIGSAAHPHASIQSSWYYLFPTLLILATFATFRRRQIADLFESGIDIEIKIKLGIWCLLAVIAFRRLPSILSGLRLLCTFPMAPYAAFCAFALMSTVYSLQPDFTFVRAAQLVIVLALALSMRDRAIEWTTLGNVYIALNWAFLIIGLSGLVPALNWRDLPDFQEPGYNGIDAPWRFGTPIGHFSIISVVAAMLASASASRLSGRPTFAVIAYWLWLALTIVLTVSRTGLLGLVLGIATVLILRGLLVFSLMVISIISAAFALMPSGLAIISKFLERGQDAEDLASLTGRTTTYASAIESIRDDWIIGHGFRASRAAHLNEIYDSAGNAYGTASHAHNAILESVSSLGIVGAICAIAILTSFLLCGIGLLMADMKKARQTRSGLPQRKSLPRAPISPPSRAVEFLSYWSTIFAFSMMDSSFALDINPFVLFFIAILVDFTCHYTTSVRHAGPSSFSIQPCLKESLHARSL